jgi:hypothetical protein
MNKLPEAAQEIINSARDAHEPSEAQLQKMLASLHAQLGYAPAASEPAGVPEAVASSIGRARGLLHAKLLKLVLSLAAVGGIAALIAPQLWDTDRTSTAAVAAGVAPSRDAEPQAPVLRIGPSAQDENLHGQGSAQLGEVDTEPAVAERRGAASTNNAAASAAASAQARPSAAIASIGAASTGSARRAQRAAAPSGSPGERRAEASQSRGAASPSAAAESASSAAARGANGVADADSAAANARTGIASSAAARGAAAIGGSNQGATERAADPSTAERLAAARAQPGAASPSAAARSDGDLGGAEPGAATLLAARVPVAATEKVLLSDDVVPLQTARKRAADKARGASDADELRLIDRAASLLRDGEPEDALELLQEHGRMFPKSQLELERRGLSVLARCGAGQIAQGRRERDAFLRDASKAPIAARVRRACPEPQP